MSGPFATSPARDALAALSRAEAAGAAPGTEPPFALPRAAAARPRSRRVAIALLAALAAFGVASLASGAWLYAKAGLGQVLLARAWQETQRTGRPAKPWPWADLHPVARLTAPEHGVDVLVLEGANGRALAWGPGHAERSAPPGARGNAVMSGHRDTHFAFLRRLAQGDVLVVEDALGVRTRYRVRETRIADHRALRLPDDPRARTLTLVTCWPFDAVQPDTPLRYVVIARADDGRDAFAARRAAGGGG